MSVAEVDDVETVAADDDGPLVVRPSGLNRKTIAPQSNWTERRALRSGALTVIDAEDEAMRPRTRGDCVGGPRPCPFVSCSHHLYLDVNEDTGAIKLNHPGKEPWELAETCSLDVADRGGSTLEEIAAFLGLTRERIRQIEERALRGIRWRREAHGSGPMAEGVADGWRRGLPGAR